ncbi:hypothetical protein HY419_01865 [candidate division WWE3 bacterium]|nr:hypothetical protein [candidate division WWE3 bacterium]
MSFGINLVPNSFSEAERGLRGAFRVNNYNKGGGQKQIFLAALFLIFLIVVGFSAAVLNKESAKKSAKELSDSFNSTRFKLRELDNSLNDLHLKLNQEVKTALANENKVSSLQGYQSLKMLSLKLESSFKDADAKDVFRKTAFREDVLGINDVVTALEDAHQTALDSKADLANARASLEKLQAKLETASTPSLIEVAVSAKTTISETEKYLEEARKVSDYYSAVTGVFSKLVPASSSFFEIVIKISTSPKPSEHQGELAKLKNTFTLLQNEYDGIPPNSVPAGLENLHKDNRKLFEHLDAYIVSIQKSMENSDSQLFLKSSEKFYIDISLLTTRSYTYEQSFWKNTSVLNSYEDLDARYQEHISKLQNVITSNSTPFD